MAYFSSPCPTEVVWFSFCHVRVHLPYSWLLCYVRQSALEGCFYEHWPIYQTKESKQWNGREGECNLRGALCNSSGLPSVLQRGLLFSHALQLGFWSVIIKEIKIWKWMWNTSLHYVLIWSLRRTNAVRCTGKMVVQPIRIPWMRRDNLSSRMKIYLKSGRAGVLLSSSLGRNCVDQFSHWSSMPYSVSVRDPWLVSFGLQNPKNSDSSLFSEESVHMNIHAVCLQTVHDFFWLSSLESFVRPTAFRVLSGCQKSCLEVVKMETGKSVQ